jgi:predicted CXXCH cytochrome family protein
MFTNRKHLILLAIVALASGIILCFCGNNLYHQNQAAGILSMEECINCHDGITGKAIAICLGKECLFIKDHSLMSNYPPPGKESDYATVSEIERAGCILENGKTTCLSCHNLTKPPPRLIRDGANLCVICHIDKKLTN